MASAPSPLAGKKVIIAGAGIAGLAFSISLRSAWTSTSGPFPELVQYEREGSTPDARREGYSVSIKSGDLTRGVQAVEKMQILDGLLAKAVSRCSEERGYMGIWSVDWRPIVSLPNKAPPGLPTSGVRISRQRLRSVQMAAVSTENIRWGVACTGIVTDEKIRVLLDNGKQDWCDFLVVADGANSRLRAALRPYGGLDFARVVSITAVSKFEGAPPKPVDRDWGLVASGRGVSLFASPMDGSSANWSINFIARAPREEIRQPQPPDVNAQLLKEAKDWGAVFKEPWHTLLQYTDPDTLIVHNSFDKEPFGHGLVNGLPTGVVFIGDSNHAVNAFAATGANMALMDAYDLAECLCTHSSIDEAVEAYDSRSIPRAAEALKLSHWTIAAAHSNGIAWLYYYGVLLVLGGLKLIWPQKKK